MKIWSYKKMIKNVMALMYDYLREDEECGFTKKDIKSCKCLLLQYIKNLSDLKNPTDNLIMEQVKELLLALNDLNKQAGHCLIETEEREKIWEIIQGAAIDCGLTSYGDDITEEWREW